MKVKKVHLMIDETRHEKFCLTITLRWMKRIMTSDMLRYRFVKFVLFSFVSTTATATTFTATILPLLLPLLLIPLFLLIPIQQPPLVWQSLTLTATIGITKSTTGNATFTQCFLLPLCLPALF